MSDDGTGEANSTGNNVKISAPHVPDIILNIPNDDSSDNSGGMVVPMAKLFFVSTKYRPVTLASVVSLQKLKKQPQSTV